MKTKFQKISATNILVVVAIILIIIVFLNWLYPKKDLIYAVLSPFLAAFIIAYILNPVVNFFTQRKIPRSIAVLIIFIVFFGSMALLIINIIPSIADELENLVEVLPNYTTRIQDFIQQLQTDYRRFNLPEGVRSIIDDSISDVEVRLIAFFDNITEKALGFFQGIIYIFIIPLLVYYFLRDFNVIKKYIKSIIPKKYQHQASLLIKEMDITLGAYFRGILMISFLVGTMTYLGLLFLRVEFALVLGIISGLTNVIPYFGPIIGSIPAITIALLESPALAVKVLILIFVIQQVESQFISPPILGRTLGIHPLVILFVIFLGGRLFGLVGLLIAVPFTAMLRILYNHLRRWLF